jgi:hypothetical protein
LHLKQGERMAPGKKKRRDSAASDWQRQHRKLRTLDRWREAIGAWGESTTWDEKGYMRSGDVEPIIDFLERLPSSPPDIVIEIQGEVLRGVVSLIRLQHVNLRPRPKHRPKGDWGRWREPNYVAAAIAEGRINAWKEKAGERRISDKETRVGDIKKIEIPAKEREPIIKWAIDLVNGWHIARRKKASVQRVKALLDGPRRRRLLPLMLIV